MTIVRRVARPMLASIFLVGGIDALRHPGPKAKVAEAFLDKVIPILGLPDDKELLVRANGATQLAGGALLATGKLPRLGGLLLASSLVPTTLSSHRFWEKSDGADRARERTQFFKNLGLLGGVLLAAVDTGGKPGLAWRAQHVGQATRREARLAAKTARREAKHAARSAQREAKLKVHQAKGALS